ncbi:MAG TPA: NosD domain-containing protein, partial [Acidimicrobiia bacterium]
MHTRFIIAVAFAAAVSFVPISPASAGESWLISDEYTLLSVDHHGEIRIVANEATVECADGVKVVGAGTGIGISIFERIGVTVRNCIVEGFEYGIALTDSDASQIVENTVAENRVGISLWDSADNTLENNSAVSNAEFGFTIGGSHNTLAGNLAEANSGIGFAIWGDWGGNVLTGNE